MSFWETAVGMGIQGVLNSIVQINALAILNGITNAFVSNLMGDSFSTQMKEFVKGFLCGFGLFGFAHFINAIYAISVLEILVVDVLAREAASAVMIVVSACDGDSSSVEKYKMQAAMYMLASVLLYRGTLPKNNMKPSKVGGKTNGNIAGGSTNKYYQVTSKETAQALINSDNPSLVGSEFNQVFVWTEQPTLEQAQSSGARYIETVIEFETNASFSPDRSIVDSTLWDIAKMSDRSGPISIWNVIEVGFKQVKRWWQFWKK